MVGDEDSIAAVLNRLGIRSAKGADAAAPDRVDHGPSPRRGHRRQSLARSQGDSNPVPGGQQRLMEIGRNGALSQA